MNNHEWYYQFNNLHMLELGTTTLFKTELLHLNFFLNLETFKFIK